MKLKKKAISNLNIIFIVLGASLIIFLGLYFLTQVGFLSIFAGQTGYKSASWNIKVLTYSNPIMIRDQNPFTNQDENLVKMNREHVVDFDYAGFGARIGYGNKKFLKLFYDEYLEGNVNLQTMREGETQICDAGLTESDRQKLRSIGLEYFDETGTSIYAPCNYKFWASDYGTRSPESLFREIGLFENSYCFISGNLVNSEPYEMIGTFFQRGLQMVCSIDTGKFQNGFAKSATVEFRFFQTPPECLGDLDCPEGFVTETFCLGNDLKQNIEGFECIGQKCVSKTTSKVISKCDYDCQDGKCVNKICSEGEKKCVGNNLNICRNNKFELLEDCPAGCENAECVKLPFFKRVWNFLKQLFFGEERWVKY